jgi:hypothetical protein
MTTREKIDLIGPLAIVQGETYRQLTWTVPGDKSAWTPRAQIRLTLLDDANGVLPLAEFDFDSAIYDQDADTTEFFPFLSATVTASLPRTKYQGDRDISSRNAYYYDLEIESEDGEVLKLAIGRVQVIGQVTGPDSPPDLETITYLQAAQNLADLENPAIARQNLGIDTTFPLIISLSDEVNLLYPDTDLYQFRLLFTLTNITLFATVNSAPVGSSVVVDINLNGVSIFDTEQLSIPSESIDSSTMTYDLLTTTLPSGSLLSFDIDQVGLDSRGTGLKVYIAGDKG